MALRFAVIADDLTGALDTGLQFGKLGLPTVVSLDGRAGAHPGAQVTVLTTDSRELPAEAAYAAVRLAVRTLWDGGIRRLYKKVDSTLRGQVAPELDAVLDELGWQTALLCPAFPEGGRILVGGYHLVRQVPLERTELAADPGARFRTSYVPDFLREHTRRRVGLVPLARVAAGPREVLAAIREGVAAGAQVLVADAASRDDLAAIAAAAELWPEPLLLAGSAGLAAEVAAGLGPAPGPGARFQAGPPSAPSPPPDGRGPVLVVAGSTTDVTRRQVAHMARAGTAVVLPLQAAALVSGAGGEAARVMAAALAALRRGRDVIIASAPDQAAVDACLAAGAACGLDHRATRTALATGLGRIAAALADQGAVAGLIITGGEVARLTLAALGATLVEITGEVQAGVPIGRIVRAGAPALPVVTKSGSLGDEDALLRAARFLKLAAAEVEANG